MKLNKVLIGIALLSFLHQFSLSAQENFQLRTITHISSSVSEGGYTLAEIAQLAANNGIDVVIPTDRFSMRWEYGLYPLRRIIKRSVVHKSILTYGLSRYLKEIEDIDKRFENLIFIPGVESAPYYYWQGNFFKRDLSMREWHKHLLLIGMSDENDYAHLPVVGLPANLRKSFFLPGLWPLLLIIAGFLSARKKICRYRDERGRLLGPCSKIWRIGGLSLIGLGIIFFFNNWPFYTYSFDQYTPYSDFSPYQNFIDYAGKKNGLTFWAQPQATNIRHHHGITFETFAYSDDLEKTNDYTGFTIFKDGYWKNNKASRVWDKLLTQYCQGQRSQPVWGLAGLAFERGDLKTAMLTTQTVILSKAKNRQAVLEAMRQGRMYMVNGPAAAAFRLDEFSLSSQAQGQKAWMGEHIESEGPIIINIAASSADHISEVSLRLIKNGEIIFSDTATTPFSLGIEDAGAGREKSYYRLEIIGADLLLVTNPIFLQSLNQSKKQ